MQFYFSSRPSINIEPAMVRVIKVWSGSAMKTSKIHHVAYRCKSARQTVEWYNKYLGMDYILAFSESYVPSTHEYNPYMHIFLDAGGGNILAFFELSEQPEMGRDENTPVWVQHIALAVETREDMIAMKERLEADGEEVVGITDHTLFESIYFFDPNGHRVEIAWNNPAGADALADLAAIKWDMLNQWEANGAVPSLAKWAHSKELAVVSASNPAPLNSNT